MDQDTMELTTQDLKQTWSSLKPMLSFQLAGWLSMLTGTILTSVIIYFLISIDFKIAGWMLLLVILAIIMALLFIRAGFILVDLYQHLRSLASDKECDPYKIANFLKQTKKLFEIQSWIMVPLIVVLSVIPGIFFEAVMLLVLMLLGGGLQGINR